jgi:exopolyphosphatase/guanosine-5'-triphosphate,3'-diphosphate pyrophosphatase
MDRRVLIIDIGGGSAEIIAGDGGRLREAFSKPLGAVRLAEMFLKRDPPSQLQLHQMREYIQAKLDSAVQRLGHSKWDRVIATSATAAAIAGAVARVPRSKRDEIDRLRVTALQVRKLYAKVVTRDLAGRRKITGIGPRRAEIIIPGIAVLLEFLTQFRLPAVYYSRAGVRDGIIADLAARNVGAELSRLNREQRHEVEEMGRRYQVSLEHGRKVANISNLLFTALQPVHEMPPAYGKLLEAAAYLHDVGHFVSNASHHKHSYYVVSNSDLAGFTDRERLLIATLCRYHRKALPSAEHGAYQALSADERHNLLMMIPILRLADNLDRSPGQRIKGVECKLRDGEVTLQIQAGGDIDLAQWGAERAADVFQQIYHRTVSVVKAKD